jgi:hypothetical protein
MILLPDLMLACIGPCRFDLTLSKSHDLNERLNSLYWIPFQTVQVAWSLGRVLPVADIIAGMSG